MVKELSDEAKAFLERILEKSVTYKVKKIRENAYRVVGVREGKVIWESDVVSDLREAHRIIARMCDVGV